jgi:isoleucyl-tRNA synthetase
VRESIEAYDFHTLFTAIHGFCAVDLSAFYFDVRKDSLYCDPPNSPVRRAVRTVLDRVFDCLTRWLAPILAFTAEEAWLARHGDGPSISVHLQLFPVVPAEWRDPALAAKWAKIRDLRRVVTGALEIERAQKRVGSSLQADARIFAGREYLEACAGIDLAEICITSSGTLREGAPPEGAFTLPDVPGVGVEIGLAVGGKCQRCWRILPEVGVAGRHSELCQRCLGAVAAVERDHASALIG